MHGTDQLETRHIFIDTSIFVGANFHYESSTFKQLSTLAIENYLSIYLTPITVREVKAKIQDRVQDAHRAVQKCKQEAMVLRHLPNDTFRGLFTDVDVKTVAETLIGAELPHINAEGVG